MKILSIDDSRMVHMVIKRALKDYDVEVITAFNGQEGVEKARAENPELILMDVNMPVMGGLEALREIRQIPEKIEGHGIDHATIDQYPTTNLIRLENAWN